MSKKQDLQKKAAELGIEFEEETTVAELETLISEQEAKTLDKPENYVQEKEENKEVEGAKEEPKTPSTATKAVVKDSGGSEVRTYSQEKHGENFQELAKSFISHPDRRSFTIIVE